jgi:hypothetical protein
MGVVALLREVDYVNGMHLLDDPFLVQRLDTRNPTDFNGDKRYDATGGLPATLARALGPQHRSVHRRFSITIIECARAKSNEASTIVAPEQH